MPPRYTIRQVVGTYRRKAFGTRNEDGSPRRAAYPAEAIVAFYGMLELAEEQPHRGQFESEKLLRLLLEGKGGLGRRYARRVSYLIAHGDLILTEDGALAVEGWDILQEGDTTIADRVARFRARRRAVANAEVTALVTADVTPPVTADVTPPVTAEVTALVTAEPRTGVARAARRARNAVATVDGDGDGDGDGGGGRAPAREGGMTSVGQVLGLLAAAAATEGRQR